MLWLDDYLASKWTGTVLVVSHDADFLDSICTDIVHLDDTKLLYYDGDVGRFWEMRSQREGKKARDYKLQEKTIKELMGSKNMNREKALKATLTKLDLTAPLERPREYSVKFQFRNPEDNQPSISVLDMGFSCNL